MNTILEQLDLLEEVGVNYTPIYRDIDEFHLAITLPTDYEWGEDNPITILISKGINMVEYDLNSYNEHKKNDKVELQLIIPSNILLDDILEYTINGNWTQAKEKYLNLNIRDNDISIYIDDLIENNNTLYLNNLAYLGYMSRGK